MAKEEPKILKGIRALIFTDAIIFLLIAIIGVSYVYLEKYAKLSLRYTLSLIFPYVLFGLIGIFTVIAIVTIVLFFAKAMKLEPEAESTPAGDLIMLKKIELNKTQDRVIIGEMKPFSDKPVHKLDEE